MSHESIPSVNYNRKLIAERIYRGAQLHFAVVHDSQLSMNQLNNFESHKVAKLVSLKEVIFKFLVKFISTARLKN